MRTYSHAPAWQIAYSVQARLRRVSSQAPPKLRLRLDLIRFELLCAPFCIRTRIDSNAHGRQLDEHECSSGRIRIYVYGLNNNAEPARSP